MQLYNSLTRAVEPLASHSDPITIYLCGITPYDTTHLGHAFTAAVVDVLVRYLNYRGRRVRYAQNVTDVDDDILRVAQESDEDWHALGNRWTRHYIEDLIALNVQAPDVYARATGVIPQIIEGVEQLLRSGLAYQAAENVYYSVDSWPEFGKLSQLKWEAMLPIANERGNRPDDPLKRDPLDFVLWQASAPGEPAWESPWGQGRPGWHMECTSLIHYHLGPTIDLHVGGADLIFPHHECEIAQAEPIGGEPFVRHWMHIAMVEHQGQKMSKSLGNLVMMRDLLSRWSPAGLRIYLANQHYREAWNLDELELGESEQAAQRISQALSRLAASHYGESQPRGAGPRVEASAASRQEALSAEGRTAVLAFEKALEEDLNTPGAVRSVLGLTDAVLAERAPGSADLGALEAMARVLGLAPGGPEPSVRTGWETHLRDFEVG